MKLLSILLLVFMLFVSACSQVTETGNPGEWEQPTVEQPGDQGDDEEEEAMAEMEPEDEDEGEEEGEEDGGGMCEVDDDECEEGEEGAKGDMRK